MHTGKYRQTLSITIKSSDHDSCLLIANFIKKQCDAWAFCVKYTEHKSARKGAVLSREFLVYQLAFAQDIIIFKEALRRLSQHYEIFGGNVKFIDRGTVPETDKNLSVAFPVIEIPK